MINTQSNRYDILASNLLFLGYVGGIIISYFTKQGLFTEHLSKLAYISFITVTPLILAQIYYIRQGKRWAKLSFLVLYGLSLLFALGDYKHLLDKQFNTPLKAFNYVFQAVLQIAAYVLIIISLRSTKTAVSALVPTNTN